MQLFTGTLALQRRQIPTWFFLFVLSAFFSNSLFASVSKGTTFDIDEKRTTTTAKYWIWVPDSIPFFKGILISHHGCGGEGDAQGWNTWYRFRYLAEKHNMIYVSPAENESCEIWYKPKNGSGPSLFKAVDSVAKLIEHPELNGAPLALFGFSGGADWTAEMESAYPDRIAVSVNRSAWNTTDPTSSATLGIPTLWAWGGIKDFGGQINSTAQFTHGRSQGGLWSYHEEFEGDHSMVYSRELSIPYMDAVLTSRLPVTSPGPRLLPMDTSLAWLGIRKNTSADNSTLPEASIYKADGYVGNKLFAAWLPNQSVAEQWKRFTLVSVKRSYSEVMKAIDTTPPLPPAKLRVTLKATKTLVLEWDILPDLESDTKNFKIYRNNVLVYDFCKATGKGGLQANGGDLPQMIYTDTNTVLNTPYLYEMTATNYAEMESTRSRVDFNWGKTSISFFKNGNGKNKRIKFKLNSEHNINPIFELSQNPDADSRLFRTDGKKITQKISHDGVPE